MEFFLKHKIIIFRTVGIIVFVTAIIIKFWLTPKEVLTENEKAQARLERMEASARSTGATSKSQEKDTSKFIEKLKETQAKQVEYMTILAMVFGIAFVGYSFIPRKEQS